jgi:hypothetical protein
MAAAYLCRFAQQRLWFTYQLDPSSYAYHIPSALRLKGRLAVEALENSFNEIIRRHEARSAQHLK